VGQVLSCGGPVAVATLADAVRLHDDKVGGGGSFTCHLGLGGWWLQSGCDLSCSTVFLVTLPTLSTLAPTPSPSLRFLLCPPPTPSPNRAPTRGYMPGAAPPPSTPPSTSPPTSATGTPPRPLHLALLQQLLLLVAVVVQQVAAVWPAAGLAAGPGGGVGWGPRRPPWLPGEALRGLLQLQCSPKLLLQL
jgi:hypothetical protein